MYQNKKVLAIIPSRGGSKRIPNKNIKLIAGEPLIAWIIKSALASKLIDRLIVSTDSPTIAKVAKKYRAEVPFTRPASLATDTAKSDDVIKHAIGYLERNEKYQADIIIVLQATSPLTIANDIDKAIKQLTASKANSCVAVCKISEKPNWMYYKKNKKLAPFIKLKEKKDLFRLTGAIYAVKRDYLKKTGKIVDPKNTTFIETPKERSIDIDEMFDFKVAETFLREK